MKLHLIRHAKAEKRSGWDAPLPLRPLTPRGLRQAEALSERLARDGIERLVSSPHLRCRQTLEPLAERLGVRIELDDRLAEGEPPDRVLALLQEIGSQTAAVCTHGDLIPAVIEDFVEKGAQLSLDGAIRCEKGAGYCIEGPGVRAKQLVYGPAPETADADDDLQRLGVVDLGSTSFRLVVFEATAPGRLRPVANERTMLRLGAAIALDGRIGPEIAQQAVDTAHELAAHAREHGAERLFPVATAALRDAHDGDALCDRLTKALAVPVRLLSGEEEARLMFRAFRRRVELGAGNALGLDLGGGSLELAVGNQSELFYETTLRIGVTRLQRQLAGSDPIRWREASAIARCVRDALAPHRAVVREHGATLSVAAGGTTRALARLAVARRGQRATDEVNQVLIPAPEIHEITERLVHSTHAQRLRMVGMRKNRADLLPTGAIVVSTLVEELGIEALTVCDWGLREGVVLEALAGAPLA